MVDNDVKETLDQATKPDRNEYKERVKQENEAETVYKKQKSKQTAHDWQEGAQKAFLPKDTAQASRLYDFSALVPQPLALITFQS